MELILSKYGSFSLSLFLLFLGWPNKEIKAQEGMLFADTTANWVIRHDEYENIGGELRNEIFDRLYFFEGNINLDGQEYRILKSTCSYMFAFYDGEFFEEFQRCDTSIHAYVREDTQRRKVFYHSSSPGPWDKCNNHFEERLRFDIDAFPFEELAMNFNVESLEINDSINISDRFPTKFLGTDPDFFENNDSSKAIFFKQIDYWVDEEKPMVADGGPLIEGFGFYWSIFSPILICSEDMGFDSYTNGTECYSKGGKFFHYPPEGQQHGDSGVCKLREPLSISDHNKPAVLPWVINPAKGKLEFLHPITGNLVVQDPKGRILFQDDVHELRFLDAQEWPQGLYLLHWENDGGVKVAKVVLDSR